MEQRHRKSNSSHDLSSKDLKDKGAIISGLQSKARKELENEIAQNASNAKVPSHDVSAYKKAIQKLERQLRISKDRERELQDLANAPNKEAFAKIMELRSQLESERAKWSSSQKKLSADYQSTVKEKARLQDLLQEKEVQIQNLCAVPPAYYSPSDALRNQAEDSRVDKERAEHELSILHDRCSQLERECLKGREREQQLLGQVQSTMEELVELQDRLDEAVETCNESVEVVEVQVAAMEEIEGELQAAKDSESALQEQVREMQQRVEQCDMDLNDSLNEKAGLMDEIRELEEQLRTIVEEVEERTNDQEAMAVERDELQGRIQELQAEIAAAGNERGRLAAMDLLVASQREEIVVLRGKEEAMEAQLGELKGLLRESRKESEEKRAAMALLQEELQECEEKLASSMAEVESLAGKVERATRDRTDTEESMQKLTSEMTVLQEVLQCTKLTVEEENERVSSSEWAVQQLAAQLQKSRQDFTKICGDKDGTIREQREQILQLEQEVDHREQRRQRAVFRFEIARKEMVDKAAMAQKLEQEVSWSRQRQEEAEKKLKEAEQEAALWKGRFEQDNGAKVQAELAESMAALLLLQGEKEKLSIELQEAMASLSALKQEQMMERELAAMDLKQAIVEREASMQRLTALNSEMSARITDLESSATVSQEPRSETCLTCEDLRAVIKVKDEELRSAREMKAKASARQAPSAIKQEADDLRRNLDRIKADMGRKEKEIEKLKSRVSDCETREAMLKSAAAAATATAGAENGKENGYCRSGAKELSVQVDRPPFFQNRLRPAGSENDLRKKRQGKEDGVEPSGGATTPLSRSPLFGMMQQQNGDDDMSAVGTPGSVCTPVRMTGSPLVGKYEADISRLSKEVLSLKDKLSVSQRALLQAEGEVQNLRAEVQYLKALTSSDCSVAAAMDGSGVGMVWEMADAGMDEGEKMAWLEKQLEVARREVKRREDGRVYLEKRAKNLEKTVDRWREFEQAARRESRAIRQEIELNNKLLVEAQLENEKRLEVEQKVKRTIEALKRRAAEAEDRQRESMAALEAAESSMVDIREKLAKKEAELAQAQQRVACP